MLRSLSATSALGFALPWSSCGSCVVRSSSYGECLAFDSWIAGGQCRWLVSIQPRRQRVRAISRLSSLAILGATALLIVDLDT